jgi:signal transduction histidine kinase
VSASGRRLWTAFAPALIGGLLLLQLVNLPLAHSLVRRLRRGQEEREALLRRALDASQTERRTIAADLHDGVVQDLVAVSYSLSAEARRINGDHGGAPSRTLQDGAAKTRDSVRALRTLLVDIYPRTCIRRAWRPPCRTSRRRTRIEVSRRRSTSIRSMSARPTSACCSAGAQETRAQRRQALRRHARDGERTVHQRTGPRRAVKRRRRSALPTTEMLESTMARLATTGLSSPVIASGMAATL